MWLLVSPPPGRRRAACHDRTAHALFLIVAVRDQGFFSIEEPMTDGRPCRMQLVMLASNSVGVSRPLSWRAGERREATPMSEQLEAVRRFYAEELRFAAGLRSPALVAAFATVPRERFVGAGPWRIQSPMGIADYWTTDDADPRRLYQDVLVALDETRGINNGQPSLWAFLIDQLDIAAGANVLHLGCGTGYYTAIMAELAGPTGKITAVEIDTGLAGRARTALIPWPQITVANADGASMSFEPVDVVVASAGATHPLLSWLDGLKPGGRLLFPMTATEGAGIILLVTREAEDGFAAHFLGRVEFIDFEGARNPAASRRLAAALGRDCGRAVQSLRRDQHTKDRACWLHGDGWCLSRRPAAARSSRPRQ